MKKTLLLITFVAYSPNMLYAKTEGSQSASQYGSEGSYFGFQVGGGLQKAIGLDSKGGHMPNSAKGSTKQFAGRSFSFFIGNDYYKTATKTPARLEISATLRSSATQDFDPVTVTSASTGSTQDYTGNMTVGLDTVNANVYFDFHNSSPFTPYIMAGVGFASPFSVADYFYESDKLHPITLFAVSPNLSAGLGVSYDINYHVTLDLSFRYSQVGDVSYPVYSEDFKATPTYRLHAIHAIDALFAIRYTL